MTRILAAGLGCRKDCPGEEIAALVRLALEEAGLSRSEGLSGLFAPAFKQSEAGLAQAATLLGRTAGADAGGGHEGGRTACC